MNTVFSTIIEHERTRTRKIHKLSNTNEDAFVLRMSNVKVMEHSKPKHLCIFLPGLDCPRLHDHLLERPLTITAFHRSFWTSPYAPSLNCSWILRPKWLCSKRSCHFSISKRFYDTFNRFESYTFRFPR